VYSLLLGEGKWVPQVGAEAGAPPPKAVEAAVLYLIQDSQKEINLKDIESLLPEVNMIRDVMVTTEGS
jgi:hypothetical protein